MTVAKPPVVRRNTSKRTSPSTSAMGFSERPPSQIKELAPKGKPSKQADVVQPCAPQEISLSQSLVDGEWLDSEIEKEELTNNNDQAATEEQLFDDSLVDPFKKRVNPNFQASQIPSYDWTAPEYEPQKSRESSHHRERP